MSEIADFMARDHGRCDELLVAAEQAVAVADWKRVNREVEQFTEALRHHMAMEEEVLFPAVEAATGQTQGPTRVMRLEHEQMRQLLGPLQHAAGQRDESEYLAVSDTLLLLMQQHNVKEESILYPMADRILSASGSTILNRMQGL